MPQFIPALRRNAPGVHIVLVSREEIQWYLVLVASIPIAGEAEITP